MSKTLCASVRLKEFTQVSNKAYKATDFNGNTDFIPVSCFFGFDNEVSKSDAYWIAVWILKKKNIEWSMKKTDYMDRFIYTRPRKPTSEYIKHKAARVEPIDNNELKDLLK